MPPPGDGGRSPFADVDGVYEPTVLLGVLVGAAACGCVHASGRAARSVARRPIGLSAPGLGVGFLTREGSVPRRASRASSRAASVVHFSRRPSSSVVVGARESLAQGSTPPTSANASHVRALKTRG